MCGGLGWGENLKMDVAWRLGMTGIRTGKLEKEKGGEYANVVRGVVTTTSKTRIQTKAISPKISSIMH